MGRLIKWVVLLVSGGSFALFLVGALWGLSKGFSSSSEDYWSRGCVTGDGALMLVSGSESQAIDLATGTTLERRAGYGSEVACGGHGAASFLVGDEAWLVPDGGTRPMKDLSNLARAVVLEPDGSLVVLDRTRDPTKNRNSTLTVTVRTLETEGTAVPLPASGFGPLALGAGVSPAGLDERDFVVRLAGRLSDGRLLLMAGGDTWSSGRRSPWAFFALEPKSAAITVLGRPHEPIISGARPAWTTGLWGTSLRDGFLAAAQTEEGWVLAAYDATAAEPRSTVKVPEKLRLEAVSFSADGSRAVASLDDTDASTSSVAVIDVATGRQLWRQDGLAPLGLALARLLDDGTVVYATTHRQTARVDPATGRVLWSRP